MTNNSSDGTGDIARERGAVVKLEPRQGKGNVARQMLRDINADYYILVDGDDTYPADAAPELLEPLMNGTADTVVGNRLSNGTYGAENKRAVHGLGNNLVRDLVSLLYGFRYTDIITGYRSFNRVCAKTLPVLSSGFQIDFFSEYSKIGLKNPLAYLDAWLDMSHRGWFPEAIGGTQDAWGWHPYLDMHVDGQDMFERYGVGWLFVPDSSAAPDTRKWLTDFIAAKPWERVPVLCDLMSAGSAIWWFVVGAGYLFHSHRFRTAFVMAMVVLYWGTLLLGPCILARYVYPLFVLLPWLFAVVAFSGESAVATRPSCG